MRPRRLKIFRSLNHQNLILGCERELVLGLALFSSALIFVGLCLSTIILGLTIWGGALYLLQKMAKADPQMSQVFINHAKHQAFYSARSTAWRKN